MYLELILNGLAAGFMLAAPVGPVGVLCIRRTLSDGRIVGLVSGLGAAFADAIFGGFAGLGVTWLSEVLEHQVVLLQFVGGIFLCFLGIHNYLAKPAKEASTGSFSNLIGAFSTTFFLTIINPMTMFGFAAFFTGFGMFSGGHNLSYAGTLIGAVFIGSSFWWIGLILAASMMRKKLQPYHLLWMNRFVGILIAAFGSIALLELMWAHENIFRAMQAH